MDATDLKGLNAEIKKRMDAGIEHARKELAGLRSGRASINLLDPVQVEAYGSMLPLNQVASLSIPEPALIVAQPFDPTQLAAIERAIQKSNLGLNPANDGKVVRIPIPSLTEERRKDMVKLIGKLAEEGRVHVRQIRREANDALKAHLKKGVIPQDDEKRSEQDIQKLTDRYVAIIDELLSKKTAEILEV
jgi:ribosome recycling factor